jgi:ferric-dicitrate binding protein FerR (iron transport regulator)
MQNSANTSNSSRSTDVTTQALSWVVALDTEEHPERLWGRFEAWLRQDPTHRDVYIRVDRAWRVVDHLCALSLQAPRSAVRSLLVAERAAVIRPRRQYTKLWTALAVLLLLILTTAFICLR